MKQIQFFFSGLMACVVALTMATRASAQTSQDGIAKVVGVKGIARYKTAADPNWLPLKVGMVLKEGATIQTGNEGSRVDLVFNNPRAIRDFGEPQPVGTAPTVPKANKDALRIFENSLLTLDKLTIMHTGMDTVTDTELNLQAGNIFGTVKKLSAASKFEVKIPNGVAGVRGTSFGISANGTVTVTEGTVVVSYYVNSVLQTVTVNANEQFDPTTGIVTTLTPQQAADAVSNSKVITTSTEEKVAVTLPEPDQSTAKYVSPVNGTGIQ